jgi:hypothetical protein
MASNPLQSGQDIVRQSMQSQYQLLQSLTGKLMNASMQMAELNREASRKLLEESAADLQKAMSIKSIPDAQAFIGEQTRVSLEKVRGYWTNVQSIAVQNFTGADILPGIDAVNPMAAAAARSAAASMESAARTAAATATNVASNVTGAASDMAKTATSATVSAVNNAANAAVNNAASTAVNTAANIATKNTAGSAANTAAAAARDDATDKGHDTKAGKHAHDVDQAPSPLVEKLIATVTGDAAKSGTQH